MNPQIPKGIEILVKKASVDPAFRARLLDRRAAAAGEIGLELDAAETMMLSVVPAAQLEAIIARTDVPQEHRRAFLGQAAAAMLAALGALGIPASASGNFGGCGGIRPEEEQLMKEAALSIEQRVIGVVAKQFKVSKIEVTRKTSLTVDLKANYSAVSKLKKELEGKFGIAIPTVAFRKLSTVGEITDYIEKSREKKAPVAAISPKPKAARSAKPSPQGYSFGIQPD